MFNTDHERDHNAITQLGKYLFPFPSLILILSSFGLCLGFDRVRINIKLKIWQRIKVKLKE